MSSILKERRFLTKHENVASFLKLELCNTAVFAIYLRKPAGISVSQKTVD